MIFFHLRVVIDTAGSRFVALQCSSELVLFRWLSKQSSLGEELHINLILSYLVF